MQPKNADSPAAKPTAPPPDVRTWEEWADAGAHTMRDGRKAEMQERKPHRKGQKHEPDARDLWLRRAVAVYHRWPIGKTMTAAEFTEACRVVECGEGAARLG